ncbi:MAG: 4-hydroxythreonine-4-phosphate dehydrogenase PdxA [Candidatus Omnitrophota bacterium]
MKRISLSNKSLRQRFWRRNKKLTLAITIGDPSGIGPEVVIKALNSPGINLLANFLVIGDRFAFLKSSKKKLPENVHVLDLANVNHKGFSFGKIKPEYGSASMEYINFALGLLKKRIIDGLVTAPISKESVNLAGYKITGHTEYLAKKTNTKKFEMMLLAKNLRTVVVTRHIQLKDVSKKLNSNEIYQTILLTYDALKKIFQIRRPRIGVVALNPHLGEDGILGKEEIRKIIPAIKKAKKKYSTIYGPIASDVVFHDCIKGKFDAVVAMYHDQALIPLKTLFPNHAVNLTVGLPFVRTSPCHGTGFDIAGKNNADPTSMIEAIKLACKLSRNIKR